jgi:hypothetical protein
MDNVTIGYLWKLFNGDLLPNALTWRDNSDFDYVALMWKRRLSYFDVMKLTCFILGNGVDPNLFKEWLSKRQMVQPQHWSRINFLITRHELCDCRYFYWDLVMTTWVRFNGKKK